MSGFPVFILFGPTASGKTELLTRLFGSRERAGLPPAELVSADSMQVYRGMDIGTAKPSAGARCLVPHHLIDIRNPDEPFNAGEFVRLADAACAEIAGRGALPVVSGGTGFYLKNFILGSGGAPPSDTDIRARLKEELAEKGPGPLMAELAERDEKSAARIHVNDTYRLLRALEVCRLTGSPFSSFAAHGGARDRYRFLVVELCRPRAELYRRIDARCEQMFKQGLAFEVEGLFRKGYTPADPGMRAIGYREFFIEEDGVWRLSGDTEGVKTLTARDSRRYAKRQLTFFASMDGVVRLDADTAADRLLDLLSRLVHTQGKLPSCCAGQR